MEGDVVIRVEGLSKRYWLGQRAGGAGGLRHAIEETATAPFRWVRRLVSGRPADRSRAAAEPFWALRDVGFSVRRGEVLGIVGRNGAGKSTLLKLLSRITEPTEGEIGLKGRVASLLEVGTGFHPELSGRENIFLNGAVLGMKHAEVRRKFDVIVEFADVEKFLDTPVKRYSSGMYVRLAFAVAAHLEPEILVVDEVLAVGDARFQEKCLGKMRQVASEQGRTVLFVSHAMHSVKALCSKGLLLNQGRVECMGPIDEVVEAYLSQPVPTGGGRTSVAPDSRTGGIGPPLGIACDSPLRSRRSHTPDRMETAASYPRRDPFTFPRQASGTERPHCGLRVFL